ncbi:Hypp5183 [Branchiostoma lanceolatum]|uniref:Hypp5183 protein n=1 Tax=Branchiostoma lanceolatum TaxID=7740 RepID=A0A8K0AFD5_BRALA|nr:Hypp5183 [Branchiostoma lanceolatum]
MNRKQKLLLTRKTSDVMSDLVGEQRITDTIIITTPAPIADITASGRPPLPLRMSFPLTRYIIHGRARGPCTTGAEDEFLYPVTESWSGSIYPTDLDSNFVSRQMEVILGAFSAESRNCRSVGALETEQFCWTVRLSRLVLHTHTSTLLVRVCSWKHDKFTRQNSDLHQRLLGIVKPTWDEDAVGFLFCPLPPNLDIPVVVVVFKDMVLVNTGDQERMHSTATQ